MLESYLILSGALVNALILLAVFAYLAGWLTFTFALDQLDDADDDEPKEGLIVVRACDSKDCNWEGVTDRLCGSIGPLCPECGETTTEVCEATSMAAYNKLVKNID